MPLTETSEPRRILVTCATGFLGAAVIPRLQARFPRAVLGILVRSEPVEAVGTKQGLELVRGDFDDPSTSLESNLRDFAADSIVHLAAEVATTRSAATMWRVNVRATERLASVASATSTFRRFLYVSTVVTGEAGGRVLTEDTVLHPETELGRAARAGEAVLRERDLPYVILRPSHIYGPGGWFAAAIRDMRRGLFRVPGAGDNWWDVVHVNDLASAIVLALDGAPPRSVFHVVDDEPVLMRDFFQEMARASGRSRLGHVPAVVARLLRGRGLIAGAIRSARSSNSKLKTTLGWAPLYPSYRAGIVATVRALQQSG